MAHALTTIADGLYFAEGPRWRADAGTGSEGRAGRLWYSDFFANTINSVAEAGGDARVELALDEAPSGLGWMPDGSLLFVKMAARELWRRFPDGRLECHADLSNIAVHRANDMVVDPSGRAYVGNFGFDLDQEMTTRGPQSVRADHPATTLAIVEPDGRVSRGPDGLSFPNGMVLTPDGGTLIVGETFGNRLTAFDVGADGSLTNRREWAPLAPRLPDGLCLDADGAVWIANPAAPECARIAPGGAVLEVIETGTRNCYACMLGGADGRTLFMTTAPTSNARIAARAPLGQIVALRVGSPRAGRP